MTSILESNTLLIDHYLPAFDEARAEHLVIDAPTDVVYEAVRRLDFLQVHSPITDLAMFVRMIPEKLSELRRADTPPPPPPRAMRLAGLFDRDGFDREDTLEGWVGLAEERGREIVFGAVGKPWLADIEWKTIPSEDFAGFDESGWAKIAAAISVREYGSDRTIVTYEARTAMTDDRSRRRFHRYWVFVSPFVGTIMRALLRTVAEDIAES